MATTNTPALPLSRFLPDSPRNRDSATLYGERFAALGYTIRTGFAEPEGCTKTRCKGAHPGFAGSEHLVSVSCICGETHEVYPSHTRGREGANPKPPSRARGCKLTGKRNAAERAATYRAAGIALPKWDTDALNVAVPAATGEEHQAAEQTAGQARTEAVTDAAKSRPAPAPVTQPPKPRKARTAKAAPAPQAPTPAPPVGRKPKPGRPAPVRKDNGPAVLRELLTFDD